MGRKRGYTYAFTPANPEASGRYLLDRIPAPLWRQVKAKARREGISIRHFVLAALSRWVAEPDDAADSVGPRRKPR